MINQFYHSKNMKNDHLFLKIHDSQNHIKEPVSLITKINIIKFIYIIK
jgi:hypothetical protein